MKRMSMLLFAVVLCFSLLSFAQSTSTDAQSSSQQSSDMHHGDGDHMMMTPQQMVDHLDQQLNLTADQKTKITTIIENSNKHADELRANKTDKSSNREAMRQLHENTKAQVRATLTADQQTKFDAMMKEQEAMHGHNHDSSNSNPDSSTSNPK